MTGAELKSFREALQATLPGYAQPAAYGLGVVERGQTRFPVANKGGIHLLPAVALASALGYRTGTCTLALTPAQLDQAIEFLSPAEACKEFDHPNLWAWRELRRTAPDGPFVAVFVAQLDDRLADDYQRALLASAA